MPKHTTKEKLVGHNSIMTKQQILGDYTRDNLHAVAYRIDKEEIERQKDLKRENETIQRDTLEFFVNQKFADTHTLTNKLTLKEKLIAQKQERLNQHIFNRTEEKRFGLTSIPFNEG
jgi:hypothetical protein